MCSWQIRTQVVVAPRRRLAHSTALIDCCGPQSSVGRHRRCRHRLPWSRSPAWRMHPAPTSRAGSAATGRRQSPRRPGLRSCPPRAAVVPRPDVGAQKSCSACQNRAPTTVTERQGRVSSRRRVSVVPSLGDPHCQLGNRTRRRADAFGAGRLGLLTGLGLPGSASRCGPSVARRGAFRGPDAPPRGDADPVGQRESKDGAGEVPPRVVEHDRAYGRHQAEREEGGEDERDDRPPRPGPPRVRGRPSRPHGPMVATPLGRQLQLGKGRGARVATRTCGIAAD